MSQVPIGSNAEAADYATPVVLVHRENGVAYSVTGGGDATAANQTTGNTHLSNIAASFGTEYETVAASQTAQVLGATGATGDLLTGVLVVPASTSPGAVSILDNATSITVFAGGTDSVLTLHPFFVPVGAKSVSGAWKVTTGASVSCLAVGNFT